MKTDKQLQAVVMEELQWDPKEIMYCFHFIIRKVGFFKTATMTIGVSFSDLRQ